MPSSCHLTLWAPGHRGRKRAQLGTNALWAYENGNMQQFDKVSIRIHLGLQSPPFLQVLIVYLDCSSFGLLLPSLSK